MISKAFRNICKEKGLRLKYTKTKDLNYRSELIIQNLAGQEKAKFGILCGFSEMDVACFTDTSSATLPFKESILFVLDHIAKETDSISLALSFQVDEEFLLLKGFVKIGSLHQYPAWSKTFRDVITNPDIPVRVYGEHPLEYRVHIWSSINKLLDIDNINGSSMCILKMGLNSISIQWKVSIDKHLDIYPVETCFQVRCGHGKASLVSLSSEEELLNFISEFASDKLTCDQPLLISSDSMV